MCKVLVYLVLLSTNGVLCLATSKANDYYSIGAHLAAASFSKALQNEVQSAFGVPKIQVGYLFILLFIGVFFCSLS